MRFTLPADKRLTHETVIPIRWGDMDATDPQGTGPVIVNTFCNFLRQLEYPGNVHARHYVCNPGRTSFDTYITLERSDEPGVIYAEGGAKTVWSDFRAKRSIPLPDWVRVLVG
jgi:acyl-CoA thioester hydrolase